MYNNSALLVLKGTSLNSDSALLALNRRYIYILPLILGHHDLPDVPCSGCSYTCGGNWAGRPGMFSPSCRSLGSLVRGAWSSLAPQQSRTCNRARLPTTRMRVCCRWLALWRSDWRGRVAMPWWRALRHVTVRTLTISRWESHLC